MRLIDADGLEEKGIEFSDTNVYVPIEAIWNAETISDISEVEHGVWITDEADSGEYENYAPYIEVHCSNCDYRIGIENGQYGWSYGSAFPMNYCPNCGAKMDGQQKTL